MNNKQNTACFSGHRYYTGPEADEARLAEAVQAAYHDGYRTFVSGMATGFDLAAAEAVVRLRDSLRTGETPLLAKEGCQLPPLSCSGQAPADGVADFQTDIRLIAAVPFAGQAAKYPPDDRRRYDTLLASADEVRMLSERYFYGCYYRRDELMVECSCRLICWYDGSKGGTRYTVRKALAAGIEIVNLFRPPYFSGTLF